MDLKEFLQFLESKDLQIEMAPVIHCTDAYSIAITHKSKIKISYSGDTRPCPAFAQIA